MNRPIGGEPAKTWMTYIESLEARAVTAEAEVATLQAQVRAMTETAEEASRTHASMHNEIQALRNQ